jgi:hypothetical protein
LICRYFFGFLLISALSFFRVYDVHCHENVPVRDKPFQAAAAAMMMMIRLCATDIFAC